MAISRDKNAATFDAQLYNKRVCITGGRGELGQRLIARLRADGFQHIVALDRGSKHDHDRKAAGVEYLSGDIRTPRDLDNALEGCMLVFHLAALTHAGQSVGEPARYFEINAWGTVQVLEACRRVGIRRVIYASTGHVYGIPQAHPVAEEHPTCPLSIYAASKLAGEAAVHGYATSYGLDADIVRLANLYGGTSGETVIGRALAQVAMGQSIALRNLAAVRDFVHLQDAAEALVRLAASEPKSGSCRVVNIATGVGVSVREAAYTIAELVAERGMSTPEIIQTEDSHDECVPALVLDNRRLRTLTGWTPSLSLKQGLALALDELQPTSRGYTL